MISFFILATLLLANINVGVHGFGVMGNEVAYGQGIMVWFQISNTGSVPLHITKVVVDFKTPSGKSIEKVFTLDDYIDVGKSKEYQIKTGVEANEVGTWSVTITIYSGNIKIGSSTATFEVVKTSPSESPITTTPTPTAPEIPMLLILAVIVVVAVAYAILRL